MWVSTFPLLINMVLESGRKVSHAIQHCMTWLWQGHQVFSLRSALTLGKGKTHFVCTSFKVVVGAAKSHSVTL